MKKTVLALSALVFILSCNGAKKSKDNSGNKALDIEVEQEHKSVESPQDFSKYGERGLKYALETQGVLGKNLMQAIRKEGTLGALSFCNEKAYPLTDSMAVVHNATIKRVSDKPRNQDNQANVVELEYIETFKQIIANEESPNSIVKDSDAKVQVYYPILTNAMCLQCHGQPNKSIESSTLSQLTILYPKDKAVGYDVNEVRGIWSVTFNK